MSSKKKKNTTNPSGRKYTTREIMEMTEERRAKLSPLIKNEEPEAEKPENKPVPVPEKAIIPSAVTPRLIETPPVSKAPSPGIANMIVGGLVFMFSSVFLLLVFPMEVSTVWMNAVVHQLNAWTVNGGYLVLKMLQGPCTLEAGILKTPYYKVSLDGDMLVFYSIEILLIFVSLFAFMQKMTWIKRALIFICMLPLAIGANIFRLVMACGLAMNYGILAADRHFNGILIGVVFIIIIVALMILEYIFSSDEAERY
jgi:exosortase/archaeosortase family protein